MPFYESTFAAAKDPGVGTSEDFQKEKAVFQRIGWRRPSQSERRWWMIQGVIILGVVLLIGTMIFLALR